MTHTMVLQKNMAMSSDNMKRLGCDGHLYGRLAVYLFDSIGVLLTPLAGWVGFPETPAVSPVTRNRRLSDAND